MCVAYSTFLAAAASPGATGGGDWIGFTGAGGNGGGVTAGGAGGAWTGLAGGGGGVTWNAGAGGGGVGFVSCRRACTSRSVFACSALLRPASASTWPGL